MIASGKVSRTM